MNFELRPLSELCSLIADCPHSTPVWTESGYLVIRNQNIKSGRLDLSTPSYTDKDHFLHRTRRAKPTGGDIIFTREAPMGEVCMIPSNLECCVGQRQVLLRPDPTAVDGRFLLFALQSPQVQHEIGWSEGTGSTVSNVRIPVLEAIRISKPSLDDQREIGATLGALDDQIALLHETNETLEAIVQAIFKSWFVDFDPVKAKAAGLVPSGIDETTASLFSDQLVESSIGESPSGWKVLNIGSVLSSKSERVGDRSIPEYSSTNDGLVPRSKIFNKTLSASNSNNKVIQKGDLVFGLSRKVLNFGQMNDAIGCVSPAYKVYAVSSDDIDPTLLGTLMRVRSTYFYNAVSASSREGQSVSDSALWRLAFCCPPKSLQKRYFDVVETINEMSAFNEEEIEILTELRDTLLPRLISGELKLPETLETPEIKMAVEMA